MYYRGEVGTKPGQAAISQGVIQEEEARGFKVSGIYSRRLRLFVDGLVIGSEAFVRQHINKLLESGQYLRRKHPIPQLDGLHLSLREQRDTAVGF